MALGTNRSISDVVKWDLSGNERDDFRKSYWNSTGSRLSICPEDELDRIFGKPTGVKRDPIKTN